MSFLPRKFQRATVAFGLTLLGALSLSNLGCARKIGDTCAANVDCSALGDRVCDLASPAGYCTVESCDSTSCPDDAVCVRFYSLQRNGSSCDFAKIATANPSCQPGGPGCCRASEVCLCDSANGDGTCPAGKSFCAPETTERRYCMASCKEDDDCREGYSCLTTGAGGAIPVPYKDENGVIHNWWDADRQVRYCAPTPRRVSPAP